MYKMYIEDIYDDNAYLFANNSSILADSSLTFILPYLNTLDNIMEFRHGRQLFDRYLDEYRDYKLDKVKRAVYINMVTNKYKYEKLISLDETNYNPLDEYDVIKQYGVDKTTSNYGIDKTTKAYGEDKTTSNYGEDKTTLDVGETTTTNTTAPRNETSTDYTTAFDTAVEKETGKTTSATNQTVDTIGVSSHIDETTRDARTDTSTRDARTDTSTRDAKVDTSTRDARTDSESGRRTNAMDLINKQRNIANHNTLNIIIDDTLNMLTYAMYL